jgi:hypothetical protein
MIATFPIAPLKNIKNMRPFFEKNKNKPIYVTIRIAERGLFRMQYIQKVELKGYTECHNISLN